MFCAYVNRKLKSTFLFTVILKSCINKTFSLKSVSQCSSLCCKLNESQKLIELKKFLLMQVNAEHFWQLYSVLYMYVFDIKCMSDKLKGKVHKKVRKHSKIGKKKKIAPRLHFLPYLYSLKIFADQQNTYREVSVGHRNLFFMS
jgi:hypothetical protein